MWKPIETPPISRSRKGVLVTDGKYIEKAYWHPDHKWYEPAGNGWDTEALDPQPTHWMSTDDLLRAIPVPAAASAQAAPAQ